MIMLYLKCITKSKPLIFGYNKHMSTYLTKIKHPFQFQGSLTKSNYFEGWYYKQVHLEKDKTISFIFGISTGNKNPHSFIQVIQSNPLTVHYFSFPLNSFKVDGASFVIDKNRFSLNEIELHLAQADLTIDGSLDLSDLSNLNHSLFMPNIMGPFAYLPFLECNHGVVSMNHHVNGTLIINHESYHFKQAIGYIEKDWGASFPKRYIWIQGNHFEDPKVRFMVSIADIPFLGFAFEGIICQLDLGQRNIRLATYNATTFHKLVKTSDGFEFELKKGSLTLKVTAHIFNTGDLKAPHLGNMIQTIKEGLGGNINLVLSEKGHEPIRLNSAHCGIEIEGYLNDSHIYAKEAL